MRHGKQWGLAFLVLILTLLSGCSGDALTLRNSFVKAASQPNYDFQSTIRVTSKDADNMLQLAHMMNPTDKELQDAGEILKTMREGITLKGSQYDRQHASMTMTLNHDSLLRKEKLWTGDQNASLTVLLSPEAAYVKTPLDSKYLFASLAPKTSEINPEVFAQLQKRVNEMTVAFIQEYSEKHSYNLPHIQNKGSVSVTLPNGQSTTASHITVTLNIEEMTALFYSIAKDAADDPKVRTFLMNIVQEMSKLDPSLASTNEISEDILAQNFAEALGEIKKMEKQYPPKKVAEMAREQGLQSFSFTFDYFVDANNLPVRSTSKLDFVFKDKDGALPEAIQLSVEIDDYMWNFGKATSIVYPAKTETVDAENLKENHKLLSAFHPQGFLHAILKDAISETKVLYVAPLSSVDSYNHYYYEGKQLYLPLRYTAETVNAEVNFDPVSQLVIIKKGGHTYKIKAGSKQVLREDGTSASMPAAASEKNGSIYVPASFFETFLDASYSITDDTGNDLLLTFTLNM
ncbi:copper amine oxidase-like protein [Aneurinibacillus soli]|uniref:Copper amine oxidase-like N-terminal domain-containing protein n=1 Tax=Aneurinibacillus soli TaxID=1500254 RepID=A0A0U4WLT6_9BACL|nr:copper amine oxidase N-terminal domain-containing protein [Aneurinibacillus soli]PYE59647.1 copper amine oxidase-like protein [Aneurinibacillus soli]BAU29352.1 hypothetical protein CB4_03539 [Aneurinibacillus soli]